MTQETTETNYVNKLAKIAYTLLYIAFWGSVMMFGLLILIIMLL